MLSRILQVLAASKLSGAAIAVIAALIAGGIVLYSTDPLEAVRMLLERPDVFVYPDGPTGPWRIDHNL
jgi:hypothetical protein